MNRILKTLVISATIAATALVSAGTASADGWRRHHHRGGGDELAIGAAGLAVGVLLGSALSAPRNHRRYVDQYPVYDDPTPVYDEPGYYEPAPVYRRTRVIVNQPQYVNEVGTLRPWSHSWMRYCQQRYRSFDPSTGTFVGYDGREHFCVAG